MKGCRPSQSRLTGALGRLGWAANEKPDIQKARRDVKTISKSVLYLRITSIFLAVPFAGSAAATDSVPASETSPAQHGNAAIGRLLFTLGFPNVHGNGRTCATCHVPSQAFQLTPQNVEARYQALQRLRRILPRADDPLFRSIDANDGAEDFTNLRKHALVDHSEIRVAPKARFLDDVAAFQETLFSSQSVRHLADALAQGGPVPETDPPLNDLERQGKSLFDHHCATCHGGPTQTIPLAVLPPAIRHLCLANSPECIYHCVREILFIKSSQDFLFFSNTGDVAL